MYTLEAPCSSCTHSDRADTLTVQTLWPCNKPRPPQNRNSLILSRTERERTPPAAPRNNGNNKVSCHTVGQSGYTVSTRSRVIRASYTGVCTTRACTPRSERPPLLLRLGIGKVKLSPIGKREEQLEVFALARSERE
ncbi:hypothetical protein KUCAC02_025117 [Chaenocephalus aceratus]|nr:hypothetical protein KUCAC02_025117 [Chaenocephalus aceratus]